VPGCSCATIPSVYLINTRYRVATNPIGEGPAVIAELAYSASGCFDGWASAKAGMAMQVS
jgi:hypothetical protein